MFSKNRRRLYIAFYVRSIRNPDDVKFHTSLLVMQKCPDIGSMERNTLKLDAVNDITEDGMEYWRYNYSKVNTRTLRLAGLQLLAKLDDDIKDETLIELLQKVYVSPNADDISWRCHNWVWEAVELLVENDIVPPLPDRMTARDVWQVSYNRLESDKFDNMLQDPVRTFDTRGNIIKSEIGAIDK
ncbi:hypothetical protein NLJ89_g197 [Agrocybe chaxingu]|uniref:Uncharacterized protein n=1 Tax=Agrocybe chaxingu TaxID=84603 RepID=A0A9W8N2E2_9AGAR|nr:hypothetical protein NLJ89_g197 [Agrocybe chaxingu]